MWFLSCRCFQYFLFQWNHRWCMLNPSPPGSSSATSWSSGSRWPTRPTRPRWERFNPVWAHLGWMILAKRGLTEKYLRCWSHWLNVRAGPDEIQHLFNMFPVSTCFKTFQDVSAKISTAPRWFTQAAPAPTLPIALSRLIRLVASSLAM